MPGVAAEQALVVAADVILLIRVSVRELYRVRVGPRDLGDAVDLVEREGRCGDDVGALEREAEPNRVHEIDQVLLAASELEVIDEPKEGADVEDALPADKHLVAPRAPATPLRDERPPVAVGRDGEEDDIVILHGRL